MKEKTLEDFKNEVASEYAYMGNNFKSWSSMIYDMKLASASAKNTIIKDIDDRLSEASRRYANHVKAIALQEGNNEEKWVPFSKNHPTIPEEYLVTDGKSVSTMTFDGKSWLFEAGLPKPIPMTIGQHLKLTHWMPLPQPPTK